MYELCIQIKNWQELCEAYALWPSGLVAFLSTLKKVFLKCHFRKASTRHGSRASPILDLTLCSLRFSSKYGTDPALVDITPHLVISSEYREFKWRGEELRFFSSRRNINYGCDKTGYNPERLSMSTQMYSDIIP